MDLANKDGVSINYNVLNEPVELQIGRSWYGIANAQDVQMTFIEENPGRVILRTEYSLRPDRDNFLVQTDYTVYASGRVVVNLNVHNMSGGKRKLDTIKYASLNMEDTFVWNISPISDTHALAFQRVDALPPLANLLAINYSSDTGIGSDGGSNRHWYVGDQALGSNEVFTRTWELQLQPSGQGIDSLTVRVADVLTPEVSILSGGTAVGTGYNVGISAYSLQSTGGHLSFYPTATQQRHMPVFVIDTWTSPNWEVRLNGIILASNLQPHGSEAIASYDSAKQQLVFQYLGILPTTAITTERTFTITDTITNGVPVMP